eukprot:2559355-Amphidinium_carterae.1
MSATGATIVFIKSSCGIPLVLPAVLFQLLHSPRASLRPLNPTLPMSFPFVGCQIMATFIIGGTNTFSYPFTASSSSAQPLTATTHAADYLQEVGRLDINWTAPTQQCAANCPRHAISRAKKSGHNGCGGTKSLANAEQEKQNASSR